MAPHPHALVDVAAWPSSLTRPALLLFLAVGACNFGFAQGPDRPDAPDVMGPPPPADFHCERGERRTEDTDHDGHPDRIVHVLGNGDVICSTEDRNHDGKIDTWSRIEHGQVVEQAVDTDFDGKLDQRGREGNWTPFAVQASPVPGLRPIDTRFLSGHDGGQAR